MLIWLASYPRSGNTFLRVFLKHMFGLNTWSLYNDPNDIAADVATSDVVGHAPLPGDFDIEKVRTDDALHIIKTHGYPLNDEDRAIYIVRDGRESVVSYFKYEKTYRNPQTTLWDVIYGNVPFGSWSRHLEMWDPARRRNTLLLRFEEFVGAPNDLVGQISDFIGISPTGTATPTFAELNKVNPRFFASGKKDSWKNVFSDEEQVAFVLRHYSAMARYGYANELPDGFLKAEDTTLLRQLSREIEYLQNTMLSSLRHDLLQKNSLIKMLSEERSRSERFRQQIAEKESRIDAVTEQFNQARQQIAEKESRIDAVTEQFNQARQQIAEKESRIDAVTEQFNQARQQLAKEQQEHSVLRERLNTSEKELLVVRESAKHLLEDLQIIKNSRRYRLGDMIARPYASIIRKLPR